MGNPTSTSRSELRHMADPPIYFSGLDNNWGWNERELQTLRKLWAVGNHIADIAEELDRNFIEVFNIIYELTQKRKLHQREGGIFGEEWEEYQQYRKG